MQAAVDHWDTTHLDPLRASRPDIGRWMDESHHWAVTVAYGALPGFQCGGKIPNQPIMLTNLYMQTATRVVQQQLGLAGLRLAQLLNQTLHP